MAVKKTKALAAADKYIAKQNYSKALNELLKVEKIASNDINLLNKIGDLYSKLNKRSDAVKYFIKVAESYQKGGFNLKAIALYKKIIRIDPKYMDARDKLVNLYMHQGHHSEAKGELRNIAEYYHSENLFTRALSCYEKMLKIDPSNLDARIKITELLLREGRRKDAAIHLTAMARELLEKNMIHEAQKVIGRGLKVEPGNSELQILLAQCFIAEGKTDEALNQLTEICRQNENDLKALKILGQTYLDRGQLRDANACFLRALHISEDETGQVEEVARQFIKGNQLDDAFNSLVHVSEVFLSRSEYEEAIRLFRGVLYVDENHLPSLEKLVEIYAKAGQTPNAVLNQEKIIQYHKARGSNEDVLPHVRHLLELDPDNREWRAKFEAIAGPMESQKVSDENTEIHVFDDDAMDFEEENHLTEESSSIIAPTAEQLDLQPDDAETQIANYLTDAEMSLKYGLVDQALEYLQNIKNLDYLHVEANLRLKNIYFDQNNIEKGVGCLVCLVNASLDNNDFDRARDCVEEIGKHRPDIAEIHRDRLANLLLEESKHFVEDQGGYDLDFAGQAEMGAVDPIQFNQAIPDEVVDFREINGPKMGGFTETATENETWSLDIPKTSPVDDTEENPFESEADDEEDGFSLDFGESTGLPQDLTDEPAIVEESFSEPGDADDLEDLNADDVLLPEEVQVPELPEEAEAPEPFEEVEILELPDEQEEQDVQELPDELEPQEPAMELEAVPSEDPPTEPIGISSEINSSDDDEEDLSFLDEEDEGEDQEPSHQPEEVSSHGPNLSSLSSELEEIDFFISVEAFDDARGLINDAISRFGEHPLVMERQHEIDDKTQAADRRRMNFSQESDEEEPDNDLLEDGTGFFDLAAELNEELFEEEEIAEVNDATSQEEIQSVEELFQEFKKGVDEQIDDDDHQTHYDLGIAYKEMGLLEEAINEFERARVGPGRLLECATMIGNCLIELGRTQDVADLYLETLKNDLNPQELVVVNYELGRAYESLGNIELALKAFMEVKKTAPDYRDLQERIEMLV